MSIVSGRLFTQEQRGEEEYVVCYDANTGAPIWQHGERSRFEEVTSGAGPRATPTYADGQVFAYGAKAILVALDATTGALIWRRDLIAEVNAELPIWGFASSPAVVDDHVIVYAGGEGPNGLIAFKASSGDIAWAVPGRGMNFSSALVATIDGEKTVVFVDGANARGLAPVDGQELWRYSIAGSGEAPIVQPQQIGPYSLVVPLGDGVGVARIEVARESAGGWGVQETWRSRDLKPSFNDFVCQSGYLFGFDKAIFACVDTRTGQRKWRRGRYGFGQAVAVASTGQILVTTERGEVVAIDASPESSVERGRVKVLGSKTWNHPVVIGNRMYLRNAEEMVCLQLKRG
jgi:outer membrane protein assembly factor BamB